MSFLTCAAICLFFLMTVNGKHRSLQVEREILNSIFEGYDSRIRPSGDNGTGPVIVEVNTFVRSINNIDDVNMVYDTQLTFRQSWTDDRLRYTNRDMDYVVLNNPALLWTPDIFFSNEQSGHFHNMLLPNVLIRIYPDGKILYSTRISLRLFCPMDLRNYPLDSPVCDIKTASYGYTTSDIIFQWKTMDPVQVTKTLMLSKFALQSFNTDYCTSKTTTGEYSCLKLQFHFSRDFFYYLVQVYMPTTSLLLLSWLAFWLNPKYSTVRFGILVSVLICCILVTTAINSRTPHVSYTKAIDVWIGVCICFIFLAMIEFCLVLNSMGDEELLKSFAGTEEKRIDDGKRKSAPFRWFSRHGTRAQKIDAYSKIFFPAAFVFFNFIYWLKFATA